MEGNNNVNDNGIRRNIVNFSFDDNHMGFEQIILILNNPLIPPSMTDISTNPIIIPIIRDLNGLLNDGNLLEDSFNNDEKYLLSSNV